MCGPRVRFSCVVQHHGMMGDSNLDSNHDVLRRGLDRARPYTPPNARAIDASLASVHARIAAAGESVGTAADDRTIDHYGSIASARARRAFPWRGVAVAAVVCAAIGIGIARPAFRASETPHGMRTYTTRAAQRATVDLPDGSRVVLAPMTTLRYGVSRDGARTIDLQGQAFFTVTPDARRPFTVRTRAITTRVLGTAFDIAAYSADSAVRVSVITGKVASGRDGTSHVLSAGMSGTIGARFRPDSAPDPEAATAWTHGQLVFKNTPVAAVLESVRRWSGYEFRVTDSALTRQRVTTVLVVDDPRTTLRLLRSLLHVDMRFDGNVVTLRPQGDVGNEMREKTTKPMIPSFEERGK